MVRGNGSHTIDGRTYIANPPVLFVIRREQVHHWELNDEPERYVLIIKKQFIDDSVDKALKELFSRMSGHSCLYLEDATPEPSASVLAAHLLGEAKRLLLYTDLIVGQIAVRLNFKDGSHFIKYFRRYIGSTAHAFRQLA